MLTPLFSARAPTAGFSGNQSRYEPSSKDERGHEGKRDRDPECDRVRHLETGVQQPAEYERGEPERQRVAVEVADRREGFRVQPHTAGERAGKDREHQSDESKGERHFDAMTSSATSSQLKANRPAPKRSSRWRRRPIVVEERRDGRARRPVPRWR